MYCFSIIFFITLSFAVTDEEHINSQIEEQLRNISKNDENIHYYVNLRLKCMVRTLEKNIIISNSDDTLIKLAHYGIETLKMPLLRFESVMRIVDGERFLAQGHIHETKDYIWQLRICDEYVKASEDLFRTYSDLLIIVTDEVSTCDVFEHKKEAFLEAFRKVFLQMSADPVELYRQHIAMAKICRQTVELLQEHDGKWTIQRNGDLFFQERRTVIELNDLVQIMDEINYKIQELAERVDNFGAL